MMQRRGIGCGNQLRAWMLLALAAATVFLLHLDREHFYAPIDWNTAKNMAIAENLSPQHSLRLFIRLIPQIPGESEEPEYEPYSRFPIGSFALVKLVISPFGDNIGAAVFAGRMLMLAFFSAAAFLAWRSISRVVSNQWIALTATMIAFSSHYILVYVNQVSNEMMIGLFGIMLTFHGMVIFAQEGKFRQLLIKVCVALLLDWHVYAILAPFIALGLGSELIAAMKARHASLTHTQLSLRTQAMTALSICARSRYTKLGVVAVAFGVSLLAFNLFNEYNALNGETPLTELPSVASALNRTSLQPGRVFPWGDFLVGQFYHVALASIPYALTEPQWIQADKPPSTPPFSLVLIGGIAVVASLVGLLFAPRHRLLLGTLALSGICWTLPMRYHTSFEEYEGIYWIGVPLTLVTLLLLAANRFGSARLLLGVAVVALILFTLSAYTRIGRGPETEKESARVEALFSDFENIRKATRGKSVVVAQTREERWALYGGFTIDYLLAGSRIRRFQEGLPAQYDFVLIPHHRDPSASLLTPENEIIFLYGPDDPLRLRQARLDAIIASAPEQPAARSVYDLRLADGALVYIKEPCAEADFNERFFLQVFPERTEDLPEWRKEHGYENLLFDLPTWSVSSNDKCAASVPLPEYPISSIRTGQFGREGEIWSAAFTFNPETYRAAYESAVSLEPDARAEFDIYLDREARTLTYLKEPCAAPDVERPFFLHVTPERPGDLPADRKELGVDAHDFDFRLRGAVFEEKCAASVPLPPYEVAGIRTGQFGREGEVWSAAFTFNPETYRAAYESAVSREPDVRAEFDIYLDKEARTLIYLKEPCAAPDVERPFFLHVTPERPGDLPADRKELGFDAHDFDFRLRGAVFEEKCAASVPLPDYPIASIRTGQWVRGEGELWATTVAPPASIAE